MARIITGIEINKYGIQAVEISVQRKSVRVLRFIEEVMDGDFLTPDALSLFFSEHQIQRESVVTSVPGDMLITRQVTVPFRDRSRINKVILYELEPLVPFPIQELEVCYRILNQGKGKSDLLVYALPRSILDLRSRLFEEAAIPLNMITVSSLASSNTLFQTHMIQEGRSCMHLHVSSNYSILSVYESGILGHIQRLKWGLDALFTRLQEKTGIDPLTLSERLREVNPLETTELINILKDEPLPIAQQARKSLQTYLLRSKGKAPAVVYVTGDRPGIHLLPSLLEKDLSIRTEIPDPLAALPHDIGRRDHLSGIYAPLGMAFMEGGKDALSCSFRRKKFSLISRIIESKKELRYAIAMLSFVMFLFITDYLIGIQTKEYYYTQIKKEMLNILQGTFPDVKNVVDELEQMKLHIKEVEKQNDIFRSVFGEKPSALDVLNEISTLIPSDMDLAISDLTIDEKSVRFVGWTDSFNTVNRIEQELKKSPIFEQVNVSNAKVENDKSRVNFQIKIVFKGA
ncbi:MAG: pilus assembly protein PilM [bacterium]